MSKIDSWLTSNHIHLSTPSSNTRASAAWKRIMDKPSVITIRREGTDLGEQTVRIEYFDNANSGVERQGDTRVMSRATATIFGVVDHSSVSDLDIKRGDRFILYDQEFEVIFIVQTIGEIQAHCEAII